MSPSARADAAVPCPRAEALRSLFFPASSASVTAESVDASFQGEGAGQKTNLQSRIAGLYPPSSRGRFHRPGDVLVPVPACVHSEHFLESHKKQSPLFQSDIIGSGVTRSRSVSI